LDVQCARATTTRDPDGEERAVDGGPAGGERLGVVRPPGLVAVAACGRGLDRVRHGRQQGLLHRGRRQRGHGGGLRRFEAGLVQGADQQGVGFGRQKRL
jgi:hypothetical protein